MTQPPIKRIAILSASRGSNVKPLVTAILQKKLLATVEVFISYRADTGVLQHAEALSLPTRLVETAGLTREAHEEKILSILRQHKVDYVLLIGYLRILSSMFVSEWEDKIISVHPSLLPAFAGLMDLAVHRAVLEEGVSETGCTAHMVVPEVDAGRILTQKKCLVLPGDTPETLRDRIQALEAEALVEALQKLNDNASQPK